jgi:hypothetical protein
MYSNLYDNHRDLASRLPRETWCEFSPPQPGRGRELGTRYHVTQNMLVLYRCSGLSFESALTSKTNRLAYTITYESTASCRFPGRLKRPSVTGTRHHLLSGGGTGTRRQVSVQVVGSGRRSRSRSRSFRRRASAAAPVSWRPVSSAAARAVAPTDGRVGTSGLTDLSRWPGYDSRAIGAGARLARSDSDRDGPVAAFSHSSYGRRLGGGRPRLTTRRRQAVIRAGVSPVVPARVPAGTIPRYRAWLRNVGQDLSPRNSHHVSRRNLHVAVPWSCL